MPRRVPSSGGSRLCAAVPGTGSRSSAPAPGPAWCPWPRRAAPARSRRPRRRAASSTAAAQPRPDLIQVDHLAGDGAVGQACGGPGQDKPGQRVGLERGELVRAGRSACLAQIVNDRKRHPHHPVSCDPKNNDHDDRPSGNMKHAQPQNTSEVTQEHPGPGSARPKSHPGNSRVVGYFTGSDAPQLHQTVTNPSPPG